VGTLYYLKTLNTGDIAAGSYAECRWTPPEDIHINRMILVERGDASLSNVQVYFKKAEDVLTRDYAPGSVWVGKINQVLPLDIDVRKGEELYWKITNSTSASVNIDIVLELVK